MELSPHNHMKGIVIAETLFTAMVTKIDHWRGFIYCICHQLHIIFLYHLSANDQVQFRSVNVGFVSIGSSLSIKEIKGLEQFMSCCLLQAQEVSPVGGGQLELLGLLLIQKSCLGFILPARGRDQPRVGSGGFVFPAGPVFMGGGNFPCPSHPWAGEPCCVPQVPPPSPGAVGHSLGHLP